MIVLLKPQLIEAQAREQAAREREALLLQMLHETQQQNQQLLDMLRSEPPPPLPSPRTPMVDETSRGEMRRRIVALLQDYPEGLSPAQVRCLLGTDKDLGSTMKAMARHAELGMTLDAAGRPHRRRFGHLMPA
jgi:hypothetical protein